MVAIWLITQDYASNEFSQLIINTVHLVSPIKLSYTKNKVSYKKTTESTFHTSPIQCRTTVDGRPGGILCINPTFSAVLFELVAVVFLLLPVPSFSFTVLVRR